MPWRMHSEYLDRLYLKNELAQGKFSVGVQPVSLKSLRVPMFVVGTETDHVAPWRAVYKARELHGLHVSTDERRPQRRHRQAAPAQPDSWWPVWQRWLAERSDPQPQPARPITAMQAASGLVLEDAPGRYVRE